MSWVRLCAVAVLSLAHAPSVHSEVGALEGFGEQDSEAPRVDSLPAQ